MMDEIRTGREFMKSRFAAAGAAPSDQKQGQPAPALEKPRPAAAEVLDLERPDPNLLATKDLHAVFADRTSIRRYVAEPLTLGQLSYLLWATQGVKEVVRNGYCTLRTVPSAGARHPFETYVAATDVAGVPAGIWRYLALSHQLVRVDEAAALSERLTAACLGQRFVGACPVVLLWTCVPYRAEWRYSTLAHKNMLLDAGHVAQNLYLAATALGLGTCAIGAYDQALCDALVGVDGSDEFTVYLAPVGHPRPTD